MIILPLGSLFTLPKGFKSLRNISFAPVSSSSSLAAASSTLKEIAEASKGKKVDQSKLVGKKIAEISLQKGITEVVFDRNGYLYHGRVKVLADAAREGGLKF